MVYKTKMKKVSRRHAGVAELTCYIPSILQRCQYYPSLVWRAVCLIFYIQYVASWQLWSIIKLSAPCPGIIHLHNMPRRLTIIIPIWWIDTRGWKMVTCQRPSSDSIIEVGFHLQSLRSNAFIKQLTVCFSQHNIFRLHYLYMMEIIPSVAFIPHYKI